MGDVIAEINYYLVSVCSFLNDGSRQLLVDIIKVSSVALLCLVAASVQAQDIRYVTDELKATVRAGKGTDYKILKVISSGTPVQVLKESEDGYARVELDGNQQGWMLSRYLSEEPTAKTQLSTTQQQLEKLNGQNRRLQAQRQELQEQEQRAELALKRVNAEYARLKQELAELSKLAAQPKALEAKNQTLRERIGHLKNETTRLHRANQRLQKNDDRTWFLTGAGVLLGGFLLGMIARRFRIGRKSSWDAL
jgi:SH3 domain protein